MSEQCLVQMWGRYNTTLFSRRFLLVEQEVNTISTKWSLSCDLSPAFGFSLYALQQLLNAADTVHVALTSSCPFNSDY